LTNNFKNSKNKIEKSQQNLLELRQKINSSTLKNFNNNFAFNYFTYKIITILTILEHDDNKTWFFKQISDLNEALKETDLNEKYIDLSILERYIKQLVNTSIKISNIHELIIQNKEKPLLIPSNLIFSINQILNKAA